MKKAKLDIWEEIPSVDLKTSRAEISLDHLDEVPHENEGKWAINKLLIFGAPLVLIVLLVCGFFVYYAIQNFFQDSPAPATITEAGSKTARPALHDPSGKTPHAGSQTLTLPEKTTILYLKDFMIDLKDAGGNTHVLMCDVAFDLAGEQKKDRLDNTIALRNIILKTTQTRSVVALRSVEERKKLKKEMAIALETILGDGTVKNVYFTNYFIM